MVGDYTCCCRGATRLVHSGYLTGPLGDCPLNAVILADDCRFLRENAREETRARLAVCNNDTLLMLMLMLTLMRSLIGFSTPSKASTRERPELRKAVPPRGADAGTLIQKKQPMKANAARHALALQHGTARVSSCKRVALASSTSEHLLPIGPSLRHETSIALDALLYCSIGKENPAALIGHA